MNENSLNITASLLDKMITPEKTVAGEPVRFQAATFRELKTNG